MDTSFILDFIYETAYFLIVFGVFLFIAIFKGRQAIINLILSLYLALLISIEFPYYAELLESLSTSQGVASAKLIIFLAFTIIFSMLCKRIMPDEFREKKFESLGRKIILGIAATTLVMVFSFQVLPVTEFLNPGTPIQSLFAPSEYFFWWLVFPLVVLFLI